MHHRRVLQIGLIALMASAVATGVSAQTVSPQSAEFIGTWLVEMTEPEALKGNTETVKVWEKDGRIAATVQVGKFQANAVTGVLRDGDLLVLSTTLRENGQPIWVVITLKPAGETMMLAQMMERSQTIKRGVGKKQPN